MCVGEIPFCEHYHAGIVVEIVVIVKAGRGVGIVQASFCSLLEACVPYYRLVFPTTGLCSLLQACVPYYRLVFPTTYRSNR